MRKSHILAVHLITLQRGTRDTILWSLRRNTGWMDEHYSVPAGHVEEGEGALEAMRREASEELGLELSTAEFELVVTVHRASDSPRLDLFFLCEVSAEGIRNMEPDKCGGLCWASAEVGPADRPVVPYVAQAIAAWRSGARYLEVGWGE